MKNILRRVHDDLAASRQPRSISTAKQVEIPIAKGSSFLDAVRLRRSVVAVTKSSPISDQRIDEVVKGAVKHVPSAFGVDSGRTVTLFGADHDKLWAKVLERTKVALPEQMFAQMGPKIEGHKGAYCTVLFFDDTEAVNDIPPFMQGIMQQNPQFYDEANGMLQFIVWTALSAEGLGCSLQHMQNFISEDVQQMWNVPATWKLKAQLVAGQPTGPPRGGVEKQFKPIEPRALSYGSSF